MTILTHQNNDHDFYKIRFYQPDRGQTQVIYNIVPKGSNPPVSGYHNPVYILRLKGYESLRVYECFEKCGQEF